GIDIDFNRTALDAERAIPLLRDLEAYPQLRAFEEPIDREDPGNHDIMDAVDAELAHHYSYEESIEALADARADGYIFTGGADELRDDAATVAAAGKPFWLQMVGTGVTAVFSAHVGAVCERAEWPAINCHQLYEHDLLAEPLDVADGTAAVPEGPGLGRRVDMDAVERFRAEIPDEKPPVDVLIETDWPDGPTLYTTTGKQLTSAARADELPYFARGVETRVIEDDGSDWYQETFERARADGPVEA
ncbi:MAG: enolase C-terminal domain-like protein, partial [Halobacteriaceae archaeon]